MRISKKDIIPKNQTNMCLEKTDEDVYGNITVDTVKIDTQDFTIKYNKYNEEYSSGYRLGEGVRTGTLIIEKTKEAVINQLIKASEKYKKIY